jgi:hypothetical protein
MAFESLFTVMDMAILDDVLAVALRTLGHRDDSGSQLRLYYLIITSTGLPFSLCISSLRSFEISRPIALCLALYLIALSLVALR